MKTKQPNSRDCFACGMHNPIGLKLQFYQTAPDEVTAEFIPPEEYQGYSGILHGGVTAAILDEAVGRKAILVDLPEKFSAEAIDEFGWKVYPD